MKKLSTFLLLMLIGMTTSVAAQEALYQSSSITPDTAYKAAKAALESCRKAGYTVAVTVVDRAAQPVVLLRDRFAGFHTIDISIGKARTAVSFRTPTSELAERTQAGRPESSIRHAPGVMMIAGGLPIEAAGSIVGGIGVSGAPGGDLDDKCAIDGIEAIREDLEF